MTQGPGFSSDDTPRFPRHVRFRRDEAREAWVLLAPERVVMPDEIAVEVLKLCDGATPIGEIADGLAAAFQAPREVVLPDVIALLDELALKGFIVK